MATRLLSDMNATRDTECSPAQAKWSAWRMDGPLLPNVKVMSLVKVNVYHVTQTTFLDVAKILYPWLGGICTILCPNCSKSVQNYVAWYRVPFYQKTIQHLFVCMFFFQRCNSMLVAREPACKYNVFTLFIINTNHCFTNPIVVLCKHIIILQRS